MPTPVAEHAPARAHPRHSTAAAAGPSMPALTIGVLALQGAFAEHLVLLQRAAADLQQQHQAQDHHPLEHSNPDTQTQPSKQQQHHPTNLPIPGTHPEPGKADTPSPSPFSFSPSFSFIPVRTPTDLSTCTALIIPGGESTAISLIASRTGLLTPLRDFVKLQRKPVWGTCAGLILLAERADRTKDTGQDLIGGLDVCVRRNYFGRQVESFEAELDLPFLGVGGGEGGARFHSVFIRAPVVTEVLGTTSPNTTTLSNGNDDGTSVSAPQIKPTTAPVEVLGRLPGRARAIKDRTTTAADLGEEGDIVAVRQGNVFGTSFHPELTGDARIHAWWLGEVLRWVEKRTVVEG